MQSRLTPGGEVLAENRELKAADALAEIDWTGIVNGLFDSVPGFFSAVCRTVRPTGRIASSDDEPSEAKARHGKANYEKAVRGPLAVEVSAAALGTATAKVGRPCQSGRTTGGKSFRTFAKKVWRKPRKSASGKPTLSRSTTNTASAWTKWTRNCRLPAGGRRGHGVWSIRQSGERDNR